MAILEKIVQTWLEEDGTRTEKTFEYKDGNQVRQSDAKIGVRLDQQPETSVFDRFGVKFEDGSALLHRLGGASLGADSLAVEHNIPPLPKPAYGKIPSDFPGFKALNDAEIHTFTQLEKHAADYTAIAGIGKATAEKIIEALAGVH